MEYIELEFNVDEYYQDSILALSSVRPVYIKCSQYTAVRESVRSKTEGYLYKRLGEILYIRPN